MYTLFRRLLLAQVCFVGLFASVLAQSEEFPVEVQNLAKAVRYQTISHQDLADIDYQNFDDFLDFLEETYPLSFSKLTVEKVSEYSRLMTWQGSDDSLRPVMLDSHYDVVPIEPGTENDWKEAPFAGVVVDGYLWGRGAIDDKSSVIANFEALESLLAEGFTPQRTLLFSLAHDEEIGGSNGGAKIAELIEQKGISLEYMVMEGSGIVDSYPMVSGKRMAMIGLAEKTYVTLTLTALGEGGHSSTPPKNSAIISLAKAVTALHENPFDPILMPPVSDLLESLAPHVDGLMGWALSNQWLTSGLIANQMSEDRISSTMVRNTTGVTMFNSGVKENVVPQQAQAKVNFRLLPGMTVENLIVDVKALINNPDINISSESWKTSPPIADKTEVGYKNIERAVQDVLPAAIVVPGLVTATTDSPHYTSVTDNIYRFHTFTMDIAHAKSVHGTNERVSVESIVNSVKLSRRIIELSAK